MSLNGNKLVFGLLATGLYLAAAQFVLAAPDPRVAAVIRQAELLVAKGEFEQASGELSAVDCAGDTGCITLIAFSYGWLYESRAKADPALERALLIRARDYYRRASFLTPDNPRILTNLALVSRRIGDLAVAVAATREAIRLNPDASDQDYLLLADLLSATGDDDGAIGAYRSAIERNAANKAARQRLVEAWRRTGAYRDLYRYGLSIRERLPELAATALGYSMRLGLARDPETVDRALVAWTAIRSDLGILDATHLDGLPGPSAWRSPGFAELRGVAERSGAPPRAGKIRWWLETPVRRDAMARFLRLQGSLLRAEAGRLARASDQRHDGMLRAIRYYQAAVNFAPPFEAYLHGQLAGASNIRLDAASDLVALHHSIKEGGDLQSLEGLSRNDLEQMTDILFSGKAGAYASGQLNAIQRYHSVLGLIYYETGRLDPDGAADNATFQLEHAISTAERIERQDPSSYRPIPELKGLLADVYRRQGKASDSGRLFLDAAMGYLETDNLTAAEQALASARSQKVDTSRAGAVSQVLAGRRAVADRGAGLIGAPPGSADVALDASVAWVIDPASLALEQRFLEGQRFKILADLGTSLAESGDAATALWLNAKALEAYADQLILLSATDLRRLQNIDESIASKADAEADRRTNIIRGDELKAADRQSWRIPTSIGTALITIDQEVIDESQSILLQEESQQRQVEQNER